MHRTRSDTRTAEYSDTAPGLVPLLDLFREGGSMAIVCHDDPDPDCLSSALGLKRVARHEGIEDVYVLYGGEISHHQNWAMIDRLDIDVWPYDQTIVDACDVVGFVDHSIPGENNPVPSDVDVDVVVDHHPVDGTRARVVDNRPSYGASATIVTEYLRSLGITLDERLATALLFGIRRETAEFVRRSTTLAEYTAAQFLHPYADLNLIERLSESLFTGDTLDAIGTVIRNRRCRGSCVVSTPGAVPTGEAIPLAADYLLNLDGARTTIVYGIVDDVVRMSARTQDRSVHVGDRLGRAFGRLGSAGGHRNMAGATVSLSAFDGSRISTAPTAVCEVIDRRLFDYFEDVA